MTDPVNAAIVEHFHTTWKVIPFPRNTCASCSKTYISVLVCHCELHIYLSEGGEKQGARGGRALRLDACPGGCPRAWKATPCPTDGAQHPHVNEFLLRSHAASSTFPSRSVASTTPVTRRMSCHSRS